LAAKHSNTCFYARNMGKETAAVQRLEDLGFSIASATSWRLQGPDKVARFYASELPRLERIFSVKQSERWRGATRGLLRISPKAIEPKAQAPSGKDWLSLEIAYTATDGFRISRTEVLQMIRSGRRSISRAGKQYFIDEEAIEEFEECLRDADSQLRTDGVMVRPEKAQFLLGMDDAQWAERQQASWQSEAYVTERLPDLAVLLRPYQMHGIRWLEHMARTTGAALLADDMGLGKTLQAIALMRLMPVNSEQPVLHMVVCPKTLIPNWQTELQRFAPEYRVLALQGADRRSGFTQVSGHDILITTYQLIARDLDFYQEQDFTSVVLDEASYIRNPDTEAAKALRSLQAQRRIALSGTPLENGVRDLWSIYQFLLPGYLGSRDHFRDRFEKPLATGVNNAGSRKVAERLRKLVRPYFLRRTKQEVLQDLPEKIEQVLWCGLSNAQTAVYRRLLEEGQAEVQAARQRSGQASAKMAMFTVLLRLRQVCCDLRMAGVDETATKKLSEDELSGKMGMWRDRLAEIISNGGKVIVFSQFVKFLSLLRASLEADGIDYCYLDGQSNDRGEQVERFQKESSVRVFLVSLKAGGYGLNLTAADHVMLMDPWWNPAVEAQAIDRAHRFGQERVVTALRLVTRGTVEEKILKLQATKRGIIEAALEDSAPLMSGLTEEELEQILE
jgi:SNF2 family DNA or RNA helicase